MSQNAVRPDPVPLERGVVDPFLELARVLAADDAVLDRLPVRRALEVQLEGARLDVSGRSGRGTDETETPGAGTLQTLVEFLQVALGDDEMARGRVGLLLRRGNGREDDCRKNDCDVPKGSQGALSVNALG